MSDAYRLGASLYVPATNDNLSEVLSGRQFPQARSLIACTEDAVSSTDLPHAMSHIRRTLPTLPPRSHGPLRFIRPRNAEVLGQLLAMHDIDRVHGFVLPKIDTDTLAAYERQLADHDFCIMPTLETPQALDPLGQREIRACLQGSPLSSRVLAVRIGGNDLLSMLAMKRVRGTTIYDTPVGLVIQQLVLAFRPYGFQLTAPVYDFFDDPQTLRRELAIDTAMGLVGKTAIHPMQIPVIEEGLRVSDEDLRAAREVLGATTAVFKSNGGMVEKAVHTRWAQAIIARQAIVAL
ncbi:HpcH/HpaI aldolase/citrate lyase family protein [Xanthomonas axonopodis pv. poinsettiicola]|uniref:Uncharacterized protein n=1 Tax=Xanthomonas codiaei TaxID=56463 RepID=A0A2S7CS19_9XANT|nr:HpcH/HpaI aldolase/citrate lyase family protein [Xanthomonas codiaei]MCC8535563.1 HpcH/HpaI aldolase/citrate lyase family protein [Xanthomonas codiaei]PPU64386.1 hypothetical protein XcodCFBP4690_09500 [Xanthomonas codiaei]